MPDIRIRGLKAETVRRLKDRAKRNGRSLQNEARAAIERAAGPTMAEALASARKWRKKFAGRKFSDSVEMIREDRNR